MCLTLVEFGGRILFLIYYLMIIGLNKSFITDHLLIALLHFKQKVGTIGCSSISLGIHPSPLLSSPPPPSAFILLFFYCKNS